MVLVTRSPKETETETEKGNILCELSDKEVKRVEVGIFGLLRSESSLKAKATGECASKEARLLCCVSTQEY